MPNDAQELAEEFGRHRAREFNVGVERQDTGVRFEDVAGIDDVKADIEEVMKMILGDAEYRAMGARPPRVCHILPRPQRLSMPPHIPLKLQPCRA